MIELKCRLLLVMKTKAETTCINPLLFFMGQTFTTYYIQTTGHEINFAKNCNIGKSNLQGKNIGHSVIV